MDADSLRQMLHSMLPATEINESARLLGVQLKRRKLDVPMLVRALVMAGGSPRFGFQAAVMDTYFKLEAPEVSRSAFYQWFNEPLAALTAHLGQQACAYVRQQQVHLPGPLKGVTDWRAIDSSTVKLPKELKDVLPGTGDYAALKVHREYSIGTENVVDYHVSAAREHDAKHITIDEKRAGSGLLVDLGYASHDTIRKCQKHNVQLVIRLKSAWNVWLDDAVPEEQMAGWLDDLDLQPQFTLEQATQRRSHEPLDVDVTLGPVSNILRMRLVSVYTDKGHCVFLTTLPRETHPPEIVGLLYRLRWCIEVDNKLSKSAFQLDNIDARTLPSALTIVHSTMIATIIANAFVHETHLKRGLRGQHRRRISEPPLHPIRVAKFIAGAAASIATLMSDPNATDKAWAKWARLTVRQGSDPNWRKRPSPIDVVKGRTPKLINLRRYAREPVAALRGLN